jgi:hypothetical protein|uniref:Uncharacterized protein n=1 Tax=Myoviridae sp. ctqfO1 TaxID=2827710 RepID=A0A8S5T2P7_9CAUD|nr:MAG TPA: hypothetical protein [Myoviridae sp. ctqfO1]
MGLDAWMYSTDARAKLSNIKKDKNFRSYELAYWRKNHKLNDFVQRLFVEKGGNYDDFNCSITFLTEKDLREIAKENPEDSELVDEAIAELKNGMAVFYTCWW